MRLAVSSAFDLNKEDEKNLKEVLREVFQTKPRGRSTGDTRTTRTQRKNKPVSFF